MITIPLAWLAPYVPNLILWLFLCLVFALFIGSLYGPDLYEPDSAEESTEQPFAVWLIGCIIMFVLMFTNLIVFV